MPDVGVVAILFADQATALGHDDPLGYVYDASDYVLQYREESGYKVGARLHNSHSSSAQQPSQATISSFSFETTFNSYLDSISYQTNHQPTKEMPSQSGQQQLFSRVEDLPGAKLGEHLHHIFAAVKSRTSTPTSSRNNSVAPSRAPSPTRETARNTASKAATPSAQQSRSSSQAAKAFSQKGYYAF